MTAYSIPIDRTALNNFLQKRKIKLSHPVKQYLHCLVLEHVAENKKNGTLMADVSFDDLIMEYKLFLYDHYLERAQAIEEPMTGDNSVF